VIEAERQRLTATVYPITGETAELQGQIDAESSQKDIKIPFDDLLIGACALERSYAIATRNTSGRSPAST
jgi:predicted nucleic acid-binding protein